MISAEARAVNCRVDRLPVPRSRSREELDGEHTPEHGGELCDRLDQRHAIEPGHQRVCRVAGTTTSC